MSLTVSTCPRCREPLYLLASVNGWRHAHTHTLQCQPVCAECEGTADVEVNARWLCARHAQHVLRIQVAS